MIGKHVATVRRSRLHPHTWVPHRADELAVAGEWMPWAGPLRLVQAWVIDQLITGDPADGLRWQLVASDRYELYQVRLTARSRRVRR